MLNTGAWRINVTGPTGLAARLVGPYLELIDAFDIMAGDRHVAPEEVRFYRSRPSAGSHTPPEPTEAAGGPRATRPTT